MIKCSTVTIKFKDRNEPRQEISATHVNGAIFLEVDSNSYFLQINCVTGSSQVVKQLNFKFDDIKEYVCEGILTPSPIKTVALEDNGQLTYAHSTTYGGDAQFKPVKAYGGALDRRTPGEK